MGLLRAIPGALRLLGWRKGEGVKAKSDRGIFPESTSDDLRIIAMTSSETYDNGRNKSMSAQRSIQDRTAANEENAYDVTPVSTIFSATVVRPRR